MRFLANARNYSVLCDIGESRGDSLSESPLLSPLQQTHRHVIPSPDLSGLGIPITHIDIMI